MTEDFYTSPSSNYRFKGWLGFICINILYLYYIYYVIRTVKCRKEMYVVQLSNIFNYIYISRTIFSGFIMIWSDLEFCILLYSVFIIRLFVYMFTDTHILSSMKLIHIITHICTYGNWNITLLTDEVKFNALLYLWPGAQNQSVVSISQN